MTLNTRIVVGTVLIVVGVSMILLGLLKKTRLKKAYSELLSLGFYEQVFLSFAVKQKTYVMLSEKRANRWVLESYGGEIRRRRPPFRDAQLALTNLVQYGYMTSEIYHVGFLLRLLYFPTQKGRKLISDSLQWEKTQES